LEKSLETTEQQLLLIERAVKSLQEISSDPKKSDEYDFRLGFLRKMVQRFVQLIEETRMLVTFYLRRPDRTTRLIDDKRAGSLLAQLTASFDDLWPLGKNLEDIVVKARAVTSIHERIRYANVLRVSVSGLKETLAGWAHILREVMKLSTDRPGLRLLKGVINAIVYAIITGVVLTLASRSLVNLSEWFQMSVIFIVAIGIFLSCLMGKPPKIVIVDLA
jgi:hypothetical protein